MPHVFCQNSVYKCIVKVLCRWLLHVKMRISCPLNAYGTIYLWWIIYKWPLLTLKRVTQHALFHEFNCILSLGVNVIISGSQYIYKRTIAFSHRWHKAFTWWYGTSVANTQNGIAKEKSIQRYEYPTDYHDIWQEPWDYDNVCIQSLNISIYIYILEIWKK